MSMYSIPLTPPPAPSQYDLPGGNPPPTGAIPTIAQLMDPALVLIAQFFSDGSVELSQSVLQAGARYYQTPPQTLPAGLPVTFEFKVDGGAPASGLLIERAEDWFFPWDDEIAYVVGGEAFPFGGEPAPLRGSTTGGIYPLNKVEGWFTPPPAGNTASQLVVNGQSRVVISTIGRLAGKIASKSLSLWLPEGTKGSMTVFHGTKSYSYKTADILKAVEDKSLTFLPYAKTRKTIVNAAPQPS